MSSDRGIAHGYRSGLEETIARQLEAAGIAVSFETHRVPYTVPESTHRYTPDFVLPNGIVVESKGIFSPEDRAKHLLVKAQHPDLDIRFVFSRSSAKLYKGSKTTLAQWAAANGYLCAQSRIPEAWLAEPPNPRALAALTSFLKKPAK